MQSRGLGIEKNDQITEVKESYEPKKTGADATFGSRQKNIVDEIRKTGVVR